MTEPADDAADLPESPGAARRAMQDAGDYGAWLTAAQRHDELSGANDWRARSESHSYDHRLLHSRVRLLKRLRKKDDEQETCS